MRADTRTISIEADPRKVVQFLADLQNLPRWAVGFAKAVRHEGDRWYVKTAAGEVGVRVSADPKSGIVDFWISPAPGAETLAASRAIPRGRKTEYTFTQFQSPGMADEVFRQSVKALEHELTVLKALLEVECPL